MFQSYSEVWQQNPAAGHDSKQIQFLAVPIVDANIEGPEEAQEYFEAFQKSGADVSEFWERIPKVNAVLTEIKKCDAYHHLKKRLINNLVTQTELWDVVSQDKKHKYRWLIPAELEDDDVESLKLTISEAARPDEEFLHEPGVSRPILGDDV